MKLTNHLEEQKMTYFQHMKTALTYSIRCQIVSLKLIINSILPFIFEDTGWKNLGK